MLLLLVSPFSSFPDAFVAEPKHKARDGIYPTKKPPGSSALTFPSFFWEHICSTSQIKLGGRGKERTQTHSRTGFISLSRGPTTSRTGFEIRPEDSPDWTQRYDSAKLFDREAMQIAHTEDAVSTRVQKSEPTSIVVHGKHGNTCRHRSRATKGQTGSGRKKATQANKCTGTSKFKQKSAFREEKRERKRWCTRISINAINLHKNVNALAGMTPGGEANFGMEIWKCMLKKKPPSTQLQHALFNSPRCTGNLGERARDFTSEKTSRSLDLQV